MDTDTFSLRPFDTATRPVVGLSNYSHTATGQEVLCRVCSEIAACGAGWVALSVSAQVDTDPMFSACLFQTIPVSMSVSAPHKWTRSLRDSQCGLLHLFSHRCNGNILTSIQVVDLTCLLGGEQAELMSFSC